jgi:hypothetical protein
VAGCARTSPTSTMLKIATMNTTVGAISTWADSATP